MNGHNCSSAAGSSVSACRPWAYRRFGSRLLLALIPVVLIGFSPVAAEESPWSPPVLAAPSDDLTDGRAIVENALDFMGSHPEMAFEALATYGAVQEDGQKIHFDMLQRVAIRLPHHLFWMTMFDDASSQSAWCDTGEFTLLKQPANIWGQIEVPPTIAEAVERISTEYQIDVPFVDILSGDPAELWLGEDVLSVDFVGPAWIDGHWTDHVAIRKPGIDIELWFRQGDEPFPKKIQLVYTTEPQMPSYTARFRKWSTKIEEGSIPKFEPPAGSEKVEVVPTVGN
jgi:hypothetical protein